MLHAFYSLYNVLIHVMVLVNNDGICLLLKKVSSMFENFHTLITISTKSNKGSKYIL